MNDIRHCEAMDCEAAIFNIKRNMTAFDPKTYCIIGMSPGNSYFKDEEVSYLLKTIVERFGRVAILIADIPAISTYIALGYPENRARRDKALPRGNALKNRVVKAMAKLGYSDKVVKIFNWKKEIEQNSLYQEQYKNISNLYKENEKFRAAANAATRLVLEGSGRTFDDMEKSVEIAVHYLLSELSFLEFAPSFLGVEKVIYAYHKNWEVYEEYIAGKFDGRVKPYLDFLLLENPYETYNPIWGLEDVEHSGEFKDVLERIEKTNILRVGFTNSVPTLMYDRDYDNFSGIFYEIIIGLAKKYKWQVRWTEEIGYGVIVDGLDDKRFDVFGSTVWPTPERKRQADFSISLFKSPVFTFVRKDYHKTEDEMRNDPYARVAIKENDISDSIAKADFSKNRRVRVPQLSDNAEGLRFVAKDKADFTFVEPYLAHYVNEQAGAKLVAASKRPIRVYENTFMFKKGEKRLEEFFDKEILLLKASGTLEKIIRKYIEDTYTFIYY